MNKRKNSLRGYSVKENKFQVFRVEGRGRDFSLSLGLRLDKQLSLKLLTFLEQKNTENSISSDLRFKPIMMYGFKDIS